MKWNAHTQGGQLFDLSHLDSFEWKCQFKETPTHKECIYNFHVTFSCHCFTQKKVPSETVDPDHIYRGPRENRIFSINRYALSHGLPEIIRNLHKERCFHTGHGKFFSVTVVSHRGIRSDYDIFFDVTRANRKGQWLNLIIQSAYIRELNYKSSRPKARKIAFQTIARNKLMKKEIKAAP